MKMKRPHFFQKAPLLLLILLVTGVQAFSQVSISTLPHGETDSQQSTRTNSFLNISSSTERGQVGPAVRLTSCAAFQASFNPLSDTTRICDSSALLSAGPGHTAYSWSTGAITQTISTTTSGLYRVTVTNSAGCFAYDSTYLALLNADIVNADTTICRGTTLTLTAVTVTNTAVASGWQLLIPASAYNPSIVNFQSGSFDPVASKLFSVNNNGVYLFDLNTNTVQTLSSTGAPAGSLTTYSYDFTNNRLIANRVGRETVYAMPATGGNWSVLGSGSFDADSYGCMSYWNPVNSRFGFFSGYGFYSVKNWVWESTNTGWVNPYANNNSCTPPKRVGTQLARNADGRKLFIFSGQGSCDGVQTATSCSLGAPWATDVGVYCWLRDIWELDLTNYSFRNILPVSAATVIKQGSFSYDFENNTFYLFGGYVPPSTYNANHGNITSFTNEVYRYRVGIDNGFQPINVQGTPPPIVTVSAYAGMSYYDARYDRIIWARNDGIWALNLAATTTPTAISYLWSTGATTPSIQVSPLQSTTYTVTVSNGLTSCTDSVRITIDSLDVTVVALDPTQVCNDNGQVRLQAQGLAASYQWLRNGVPIPGATSPLYVATQSGLYRVILQSAIGCSDTSSSINVSVLSKPVAAFTANQSTQCLRGNQFTFSNTSTLATGTLAFLWNFGNTLASTLQQPTISYTNAGSYTVTLIATGSGGCSDTLYRQVTVDPSPAASFTINSNAQCLNDNLFSFTSTSTISQGSISHLWDFGTTFSSNLSATTYSYLTHGQYNVKLVVTSDRGCSDSLIRPITVHPKPLVNFTINDSAQCLNANRFIFTNSTSVAAGNLTYFWTFGDGNTETIANPTHTYQYPQLFTVVLRATSDNGCIDSLSRVVAVDPKPSVNFTINNPSQCLLSNQFQFTNNSSIATGSITYQWSFGAGPGSTLASPSFSYTNAGTYSVTLVATSNLGCIDSLTRQVVVNPLPTGALLQPATTVLCEGQSVLLSASGGVTYQWSRNGVVIPGAVFATHSATQPGTYTVQVFSASGCGAAATGSVTLQLFAKPVVDFTYNKSCARFPIQFSDQSTLSFATPINYSWSFGAAQGNSGDQNPLYTYTTAGFYTVSLTVRPLACPTLVTTVSKPVSIVAPPPNERYPSLNALQNIPLALQARQFDNAVFTWSPTIGLNDALTHNPTFNYNAQVQYLITIRLSIGCVITDTLLVRMFKEREIHVPKGFSPNGDGKNDVLYPRVVGIKALRYFKIYNRWGQLVFQTDQINAGWDGVYRGAKQPSETYVWSAEGIDIDDQVIRRNGTFILIR